MRDNLENDREYGQQITTLQPPGEPWSEPSDWQPLVKLEWAEVYNFLEDRKFSHTPIEDVLLQQARLRASSCPLTRAALDATGSLSLTFITSSADAPKVYTGLVLDDGQIGPSVQGSNLMGQIWEEIRSGGIEMLNEPLHVVCSSSEKTFFEHTSAVVHVADDLLQKTRFFQNNCFSGSCMATHMTLGIAGRTPDDNDLFQQLLDAIEKIPHVQVIVTPPPPIQNDAYVRQAKQLTETFPELYGMTDTGGSLLQIGRYGTHADRRYVSGDKWDKDGILALKAHLVQVLGHHWLRNTPKASAAFPLRQLHQLQLDSSGKTEPVEEPSPAPLNDLPGEAPPQSSSSASAPEPSEAVEAAQPVLAPPEEAPYEMPEWIRHLLLVAPSQPSCSVAVSSAAGEVPLPAPLGHLSGEAPPQSSSSASAPVSSEAVEAAQPVLAPPEEAPYEMPEWIRHLLLVAPSQPSCSVAVSSAAGEVPLPAPLGHLSGEAAPQSSSSASAPVSSEAVEAAQPVFVPPEEAPFECSFVPPEEFPLQPLSAADLGTVYAEGAVPVFATPKKSSGGAPIKRAGEDEYEVASIGTHRWVPHGRGKMVEYCVAWRGHDQPTYEKASQFVHANSILKKYRAANNLL